MQGSQLQRSINLLKYGSGAQISFNPGHNTLTTPSGANVVVLSPPPDSTVGMILKGNANDSGIALVANAANVISISTGNMIVSAAASVMLEAVWHNTDRL